MSRPLSLRWRLLLAAALTLLLAMLLVAPLLFFSFRDAVLRSHDQRLQSVMLALVASVERAADGSLLQRKPLLDPAFERPGSGWYWQIRSAASNEGAGPVLRSRSLWDRHWPQHALAPAATPVFSNDRDFNGQSLRVASQSIRLGAPDGPQLDLLVIGEVSAVNAAAQRFAAVLALALGGLLVALLAAIGLQVRYGLYPLRRLRAELQRVERSEQQQLQQSYPLEVQPLAEQLNGLLERNRAVVERARNRTADLAHALKLPLSRMHAEAQLPTVHSWALVQEQVQQVRQLLDHHLTLAASAAHGQPQRVSIDSVSKALLGALARIHAERGLRLHAEVLPQLCFLGDPQDLQEMLGNLLDNACKWARSQVWLTAAVDAADSRRVCISVSDDGPGLPAAALSEATRRGIRFDQRTPGSGLGLHIVGQLAADYGGELQLDHAGQGGLCATLRLPRA